MVFAISLYLYHVRLKDINTGLWQIPQFALYPVFIFVFLSITVDFNSCPLVDNIVVLLLIIRIKQLTPHVLFQDLFRRTRGGL